MKINLNIDITEKQLEQLEAEALRSFNDWSDTSARPTAKAEDYWPTPLELFAMRLLLFEITKK